LTRTSWGFGEWLFGEGEKNVIEERIKSSMENDDIFRRIGRFQGF